MSTVADIFDKAERYFELRVTQLLREKRLKAEENGTALNARKAKRDARTAAGREKLDALVKRLSDLAIMQEQIIAAHCPDSYIVRAALDAMSSRVWMHEVPPPPPRSHINHTHHPPPPPYAGYHHPQFFPPPTLQLPPPMPPPLHIGQPIPKSAHSQTRPSASPVGYVSQPIPSISSILVTSTGAASKTASVNEDAAVCDSEPKAPLFPATESVLKHLGPDFGDEFNEFSPRSVLDVDPNVRRLFETNEKLGSDHE